MATNSYTDRELLDFNYKPSDKVNSVEAQKTAAELALNNYGPYNFNYGREADYNKAIDAILNREKFSYDLNGDALYQQYKDNYINQGRMAMMDTMGQAAAMTGGYGNSYAATVGNQAYQASLQNLNNMIPELYQLALQSYNAEGDRLATNFNVLGTDREIARSEYETKYNADISRLTADRDYYSDNYNNERSFDYTNQHDTVQTNNENYWNEYKAGYQAEQDAIAQANWEKQYALDERQVAASEAAAAAADKSAYYEANSVPYDEIDVNDDGIVTIKGEIINGTIKTPTINGFQAEEGDNFDVTIGENTYRVENEGKVESKNTLNSIKKGTTYGDITIAENGNAYIKQGNDYYRIGNLNNFRESGISKNSGYSDMLFMLQG